MLLAIVFAVTMPQIDSIRIGSRWDGLGKPSDRTYEIVRRGDAYDRGDAMVPAEAVARFAAAVNAKPVDRKTALRGIATREWLSANARVTKETQCVHRVQRIGAYIDVARPVSMSEYDPDSGSVDHARFILPNGEVIEP
jgi:hypothetical protein